MTPVGHCIAGATLGLLAAPREASRLRVTLTVAGCALIADIPDIEIPLWGHSKYYFSHSLFSNLMMIGRFNACPFETAARVGGKSYRRSGRAGGLA